MTDNKRAIEINKVPIEWDLGPGTLRFFERESALFWISPSLSRLLGPLRQETGDELYDALITHQGSLGTDEDYDEIVETLGKTFAEGFIAWGEAVSAAGWGSFELMEYDESAKSAIIAVSNPWELGLSNPEHPATTKSCPFLKGKIIGIFSRAFRANCWAEERIEGNRVEFRIEPSSRTIEQEALRCRWVRYAQLCAQTWSQNIRLQCERGNDTFTINHADCDELLFKTLAHSGYEDARQVSIVWSDGFVATALRDERQLSRVVYDLLMAIHDVVHAADRLDAHPIRLQGHGFHFAETQLGRVVVISVDSPYLPYSTPECLAAMPALSKLVQDVGPSRPLENTRILLVHHFTKEVLGTIEALRQLGCADISCLFVSYSGDFPSRYLEAVLALDGSEFRCAALQHVTPPGSVEGFYEVARNLSFVDTAFSELPQLEGRTFLHAMRAVAKQMCADLAKKSSQDGTRLLVVEDGGYVGPDINGALLKGEARPYFGTADAAAWCQAIVGTIEHTRNGYNRLMDVQRRHDRLALPAFTIAVSPTKLETEAEEVAISIISAMESILHSQGLIVSARTAIVLGSRGAIGTQLVHHLGPRIRARVAGVDLRATDAREITESTSYQGLPLAIRREVDVLLGVIGESILTGADVEDWLTKGNPHRLFLVSGSTKTEEFRGFSEWMQATLDSGQPRIQGREVTVHPGEIRDTLSDRKMGRCFRFEFQDGLTPPKTIYCLAELMPVNFLFYGVPTETIDLVLTELVGCTVGMAKRTASPDPVPLRVSAVGHEIDSVGQPLPES